MQRVGIAGADEGVFVQTILECCGAIWGDMPGAVSYRHLTEPRFHRGYEELYRRSIDEATTQAGISSQEATMVAKQSAQLSQQLNRLTRWVIAAELLSAIAATIQAGAALYAVFE